MTEERRFSEKKLIIALALVLIAAAVSIVLYTYLSKPEVKLNRALKAYDTDESLSKGVQAVLDADPALGESAQALLTGAVQEYSPRPYILSAALIANELTAQGLDADFAANLTAQTLRELNYADLSGYNRYDALGQLLLIVAEEEIPAVLEQAGAGASRLNYSIREMFLHLDRELSAGTMMDIASIFILKEVNEDDVEGYISRIPAFAVSEALELLETSDESQRTDRIAILRRRYTETADALAFMRGCALMGIKPSEVYPDGLTLNADFSKATNSEYTGDIPIDNTFLIISRTEKDEPRDGVSSTDYGLSSLYSPNIAGLADSGPFSADYDGNDKSDPANYTVRVETALMDNVPAENLPASLEECSYIILMDSTFQISGSLTETTTSTYGSSTTKMITEYPVYDCWQSVWLCAGENQDYLFLQDYQQISPPEPPSTATFMTDIDDYLLGRPDPEWAKSSVNEMLADLEAADWNFLIWMLSL